MYLWYYELGRTLFAPPLHTSTTAPATALSYSSHFQPTATTTTQLQHYPTAPIALAFTPDTANQLPHCPTALTSRLQPQQQHLCGFWLFFALAVGSRNFYSAPAKGSSKCSPGSCLLLLWFGPFSAPAVGCGSLYSARAKRSSQCNAGQDNPCAFLLLCGIGPFPAPAVGCANLHNAYI